MLKALEKDRNRRYETANALSADLQRFLDHKPLMAGPPSTGYRLRKFVRRHRGPVLAVCAVLVALVLGGISTMVQLLRVEQKAAENANLAQEKSAKVREFELFKGVVRYRELVAREASLYPAWPHKKALLEAWLRDCGELLAMRAEIERTIESLRAEALPWSDAEQEHDRTTHPRAAELHLTRKIVAARRHAEALREGREALVVPDLTVAQQALDVVALNGLAWERVAPTVNDRRVFSEESLGLALARLAATKAKGMPSECSVLDTLAWALRANGMYSDAKSQSDAALAIAPSALRETIGSSRRRLHDAIADAPNTLAVVESSLAALVSEVEARRTW
ncbi:MAG: hypothetical protein K8H99_02045, partial [Nitrospirae bacterium]|nr:hypothetical protein [Fimbriimonadaceae bacterium]